jgi:NAD(P)-dependent dehydrogenase (short-subunit alcohol dehydrogenase family)
MNRWDNKTWFITGASSGFGRAMAELVLKRGGRVVATARDCAALADLVGQSGGRAIGVPLDVTKSDQVTSALRSAEAFGGIDVVFNNAGFGMMGGIEEAEDKEIRAIFEVNFFGALRVVRAVLPKLRARGSGFILNVSSVAGVRAVPGLGYYAATKFALEGMSEALVGEVEPFSIRVMIVEPGPFRTDFRRSSVHVATPHPAYPHLAQSRAILVSKDGRQTGDPARGAAVILNAMESDNPPRRLVLGGAGWNIVKDALQARIAEVEAWRSITQATDFES